MSKHLHLKESTAEAPVKKGKRWRVIVARPGKGSSGTYSEEMFRRDAENIIAPGGQSFINHDDTRNPKDMIGVYPEGSFWSEEDNAVVSELEVFSHWEKFVEEVGPHCGISLYALGEADEDGNVTKIIPDRLNGADLVARPGLIGSGLAEKLYESAISHSDERTAEVAGENRKKNMEKEILDALNGVKDALNALTSDKAEKATATAKVEADAEAAKIAAEQAVQAYSAAVEAVDAADLFESQRKSILAAAAKGEDVSELISEAKAVKEEAVKAVKESASQDDAHGVVLGESAGIVNPWKGR